MKPKYLTKTHLASTCEAVAGVVTAPTCLRVIGSIHTGAGRQHSSSKAGDRPSRRPRYRRLARCAEGREEESLHHGLVSADQGGRLRGSSFRPAAVFASLPRGRSCPFRKPTP